MATSTLAALEAQLATLQATLASVQSQIAALETQISGLTSTKETALGTAVKTAGVNIYASNTTGKAPPAGSTLDTWSFNTAGTVVHNGVVDANTGLVTELFYDASRKVWQYTPSNAWGQYWWYWTGETNGVGGSWLFSATAPTGAVVTTPTGPTAPTGPTTPTGPVGTTPVAPPQAVAASFTKLVFNDDFTSASTITGSSTVTSGFKWYSNHVNQSSPANYQVLTTTTAAQVKNGNTDGGKNASPLGGILALTGIASISDNGNFSTASVAKGDPAPSTVGCYKHGYFEAYIQFNNKGKSSATGWPAFWSWSAQGGAGTEVDFLEVGTNPQGTAYGGSVFNWGTGGKEAKGAPIYNPFETNSQWHTYGFLWTATGNGTGSIAMYIDNVKQGATLPTGTGSNIPLLENDNLYLVLGTGLGWPMYVDWVRVWQ